MKKLLVIMLTLLTMVGAVGAVPVSTSTTVDMTFDGKGTFDFNTRMTDLTTDNFHGESTGDMHAEQHVRIGESAQWAGDGADIDRLGSFTGGGIFSTYSDYLSSGQWYPAHSEQDAWVISDATGNLMQSVHFDYNSGGVYEIDQWKKQRNMGLSATGNYDLGYSANDVRNNDWSYNFEATGNTMGNLFVDTAFEYSEHGRPDSYNSEWDYIYSGTTNVDINHYAKNGGYSNVWEDAVNNHCFGDLKLW